MKRNFMLRGCLVVLGLAVLLLAAAGVWWFLRPADQLTGAPPSSPVLVFLVSPASGDEFSAGDILPVQVQSVAPDAIQSAELFVDGQSLGLLTDLPENASWSWQAWPAGIHTLYARATAADGQVGQSQTVIVNVLARGGLIPVSAEEGQTLEQIGASYGVAPNQIAVANPHVDPTKPLQDGFPVRVPGDGGSGSESGEGGGEQVPGGDLPPISLITWQFTPTEAVDKSYCYLSTGGGQWEKIPKKPFHFFNGPQKYVQYDFSPSGDTSLPAVQAQCWGWQGGTLIYLGQGESRFDAAHPPNPFIVAGQGFELVGMPQMKTMGGGGSPELPPPYSLRRPFNAEDCASHFPNPLAAMFVALYCDELLSGTSYYVLEWEWQSNCWWGQDCINAIDGYHIYEIDYVFNGNDITETIKYLKEIDNPNQKVTAVPVPPVWGYACFGVKAYVKDSQSGGEIVSQMATYCPKNAPAQKTISLTPAKTGTVFKSDGDHSSKVWCTAVPQPLWNDSGPSGFKAGNPEVGHYRYSNTGSGLFPCWEWYAIVARGFVQFDLSPLAGKSDQIAAVTLEFDAKNFHESSLGSIRIVNAPWGPFDIAAQDIIIAPTPVTFGTGDTVHFSLTIYYGYVRDWVNGTQSNHGILFVGWDESLPAMANGGYIAKLTNLVLKVHLVEP